MQLPLLFMPQLLGELGNTAAFFLRLVGADQRWRCGAKARQQGKQQCHVDRSNQRLCARHHLDGLTVLDCTDIARAELCFFFVEHVVQLTADADAK